MFNVLTFGGSTSWLVQTPDDESRRAWKYSYIDLTGLAVYLDWDTDAFVVLRNIGYFIANDLGLHTIGTDSTLQSLLLGSTTTLNTQEHVEFTINVDLGRHFEWSGVKARCVNTYQQYFVG